MDRAIRIGKYLARRALGAGSFATVWLAYDELLDAEVAVKVLADNWAQHPDVRRRFIDEAKLLRRIDHERIVRVHDVDELPDGRPFFVMTWADRGTLHDRLREYANAGTPMPIDVAVRLAVEVCECLAVVHDFGAVHRDVKPSNVLFRSVRSHERSAAQRRGNDLGDEQMVLGDFGLAKDLAAASGFTQAAGTPAYMAPEQARPTAIIDRRVDIFGAASVLYEMLTGKPPIAASTLSGVRRDRDGSAVQPIRALRPEIPPKLAAVIGRGLAFDPDQRYASAPDLAAALLDALTELPASAPAVAKPISLPPAHAGPAGRVHDLVTLARRRNVADGAVLDAIEQGLSAPMRVVALGGDAASPAWSFPRGATLVTLDPADTIDAADLVITTLPDGDAATHVDAVKAFLARLPVAPVAVVALSSDPAARAGDVAVRSLTVDVVADDADGQRLVQQLVAALIDRASLVQASAALVALRTVLTAAAPEHRQTVHDLVDAIDALRLEIPMLLEIDVLRDDAAGRSTLPVPLRRELRRLLVWTAPARRLGLPDDSEADLRAATQTMLERWRTLSNTGRVPFTARGAAEVVERSLERLYVELDSG